MALSGAYSQYLFSNRYTETVDLVVKKKVFFSISKKVKQFIRHLFQQSRNLQSSSKTSFEALEWSYRRAQKKKAEPKFIMKFWKKSKSLPFVPKVFNASHKL